jgi:hypothetical protein
MTDTPMAEPRPPQPPEIDRRSGLSALRLIAFSVIGLLPFLALVGLFAERLETVHAQGEHVLVAIEYPRRTLTSLTQPLTVEVENRSQQVLPAVEVAFDPAYIQRFSEVSFMPPARDAYVVSLASMRPAETRRVRVDLRAETIGLHEGRIVVRASGAEVALPISTIVLP